MKINPIALFTSLAVLAAGTFGYVVTQQPRLVDVAKLATKVPEIAKVETPKAEAKPEQQAMAVTPAKPAAAAEPVAPTFDTVRVETGGEAVIAGRAAPGTEVVAKLNGQVVASTTVSPDGSFVMIPQKALPAGAGALILETKVNGVVQVSTQTVAIAVKPKGEGENTVAVLTPDAPTKVVQAPKSETVTLDTVDYGASGNIQFAGRSAANAVVRLYVDNMFLGEAKADAEGKWNYGGGTTIVAGVYTLRVDELGAKGEVKSRIESPFKREEAVRAAQAATPVPKLVPTAVAPVAPDAPVVVAEVIKPAAPEPVLITVQPGDNLWVISRNVYGFGREYTVIYEANKQIIKNPSMIFPGQIITAPVAQAQ